MIWFLASALWAWTYLSNCMHELWCYLHWDCAHVWRKARAHKLVGLLLTAAVSGGLLHPTTGSALTNRKNRKINRVLWLPLQSLSIGLAQGTDPQNKKGTESMAVKPSTDVPSCCKRSDPQKAWNQAINKSQFLYMGINVHPSPQLLARTEL